MVQTATILRDTIFYIKDFLDGEITDPISNRPTNQKFIMTSYPTRATTYPLITIKDTNSYDSQTLGFQSEASQHYIEIEIRVWAKSTKQRDDMADQIYQKLKDNQIGASGTSQANDIHDFQLLSSVNVDEPEIKSKVMSFKFLFIAT